MGKDFSRTDPNSVNASMPELSVATTEQRGLNSNYLEKSHDRTNNQESVDYEKNKRQK